MNGTLIQVEEFLAASLANSAEFQTLCEAADASAAAERIYYDEVPITDTVTPLDLAPYALVATSQDRGFSWKYAATDLFTGSGSVWLRMLRKTFSSERPDRDWKIQLGTIVEEILAQSEEPGRLHVAAAHLLDYGRGYDIDENCTGDQMQVATIQFDWGRQ